MPAWRVLVLAALVWTPLLFLRPPTRQQELRVLVTARNMVESGDWLHPEFQNRPRYRKPPLAYWLAASAMRVTGRTRSAPVARLPFALLGLSTLALLMRMAGPDTGPLAAALLVFSLGWTQYAALAETDIPLLFGITAALWFWRRGRGPACGASMAFAFLAKGPAGLAIPLLTMASLARRHARPLRFWTGALLPALAVAGAWTLFLRADPAAREALSSELRATFVDTEHENPWFYYVYTLPWLLLPSLLIFFSKPDSTSPPHPNQVPAAARNWFVVGFVLLTLVVSKQRHYALLLLPPAAWILASRSSWFRLRPFPLLAGIAAAAAIGLSTAFLVDKDTANARFLSRTGGLPAPPGRSHAVGINSAVFDFHLGRHVDNTDSARHALARAQPGDTVTIVQKRSAWDARAPSPNARIQADDVTWIRRHYVLPPE